MPSPRTEQRRAAHVARYGVAEQCGGNDLRNAVKVYFKHATFTDWSGAVQELAAGVTVRVYCGSRGVADRWPQHKVRLNPDGSVDLLSHPGIHVDVDTELFLSALGGESMCSCVAAAVHLPTRTPVPRTVLGYRTIDVSLRTLHTAISWAQRPDTEWTPTLGQTHFKYGISPDVVAAWTAQGWTPQEALPFQQEFATLEVANSWREAGDLTRRAAKLAGRGERPDAEARWAAVGFSPARSARWHDTTISPTEAFEWDRHRVPPMMVSPFTIQAARPGGIPVKICMRWCAAGLPASRMLSWYHRTDGDLDEALDWHRAGLKPADYDLVQAWNHAPPSHHSASENLSPAQVRPYVKAGLPACDPALLSEAVCSRVSAEQYREAVDRLSEGDGGPLMAALAAHRPRETDRGWHYSFTDGRDRRWALRSLRQGHSVPLARFVLRWLDDHAKHVA